MSENLNVDKFRNGYPIPHVKTNEGWKKAGESGQPAWCSFNNNPGTGSKYGKLYNWYALNNPRGLAPEGWHIPSDIEWNALIDYLGGKDLAGKKMKSTTGWNEDGNGINESGFSGLPSGFRHHLGTFSFIGRYGFWWSFSEDDPTMPASAT